MGFNAPPPKPRGLLWKKNRKWAEDFYRWMSENQPQYGGPLEKVSNGFVVSRPTPRPIDIPHFSPVVTGTTSKELGITWGWFHGPKDSGSTEIPDHHLYPYMPSIGTSPGTGLVLLDAATPNKLALNNSNTTLITLKVTLVRRSATMGETHILNTDETAPATGIGSTGLTVWVVNDSHGHAVTAEDPGGGHNHDHSPGAISGSIVTRGQLDLLQLAYHIDEGAPPEFIATAGTTWPVDTELVINIPWGEFVLDSDGGEVSRKWYWTGDRDFFPPGYVKSAVSSEAGHTIADSNPATGASDADINPS